MTPAVLSTPVVVIAFNRPSQTRRTMDAVRRARPERLFLIADGPRPGHPGEADRCSEVRQELSRIDWECTVERRFSERNLGCEPSVELGLDWVFSVVDQAIILEDDCLPDPTFFPYCEELLSRFRNDERVWHIAGNSMAVPRSAFDGDSYALASFASVWGWATWRRAWRGHRALFPREHDQAGGGRDVSIRPHGAVIPDGRLRTEGGRQYFQGVADSVSGTDHSWDSHWWLSMLAAEALAITPAVNLVENIGFGEDATYTKSSREMPPAEAMDFPMQHPRSVTRRPAIDRELELLLATADGALARWSRRVLGNGRLRVLARRLTGLRSVRRLLDAALTFTARIRRAH